MAHSYLNEQGESSDRLFFVGRIVEASLGSQLKPLIFGAKIMTECLDNLTNLKVVVGIRGREMCPTHRIQQCLEKALSIRIGLLHHLDGILDTYREHNPLAAALKP